METMHSYIAYTNLVFGAALFCIFFWGGGGNKHFGTQEKLSWGARYAKLTLDILFNSGKCNSSYCSFCITPAATKPMINLCKLTYTEFDFPLNFYTYEKL